MQWLNSASYVFLCRENKTPKRPPLHLCSVALFDIFYLTGIYGILHNIGIIACFKVYLAALRRQYVGAQYVQWFRGQLKKWNAVYC